MQTADSSVPGFKHPFFIVTDAMGVVMSCMTSGKAMTFLTRANAEDEAGIDGSVFQISINSEHQSARMAALTAAFDADVDCAAQQLGLMSWKLIARAARQAEENRQARSIEKDSRRESAREAVSRLRSEMHAAIRSLNHAAASVSLKKILEIREQFFADYSEPI